MQLAIRVPTINPIKTEMERKNPLVQTSMAMMMRMVIKAAIKFFASPKSLACAFPPPIFWKATGIKVSPITVIKVPVTTGGKIFLIFENQPAIRKTKIPATIMAPYIVLIENFCPIISKGATA